MKVKIFVEASAFIAALGLACLLPGTAHAQFEPAPDFFELSTTAPPAAQPTQIAANASMGDFHGTFSLPYDVECSGHNLKSGQYTLSVKSDGTNRMVTMLGGTQEMNIRVRRVLANSRAGRSALVMRKSGDRRLLEAVYVQKLNLLLYLDESAERSWVRMEPLNFTKVY
jgi:hypothetical protein